MNLGHDYLEGLVRQGLLVIMSQVSASHSSSLIFPKNFFILRNFHNTFPFDVIPAQLKMGAAIIILAVEREANIFKLQKVQALEHKLERKHRRLAIEEVTRDELEVEVAQKEQLDTNLWEAQKREIALAVVVEKLQREVAHL